MKILFVYSLRDIASLQKPLPTFGEIHLGLSCVAAYQKSQKHQTRLLVLSSENEKVSFSMLEDTVTDFSPAIIGFTAVSTQYPFITEVARFLKQKWPNIHLILGGSHASLNPGEIDPVFDSVCVGEGEEPLAELAGQLAEGKTPQKIPNLCIRQTDGSREVNPPRNFMADLDSLPHLDRDMWREWVADLKHTCQVVLPSRGCPYNCSYCSNHKFRKLAGGAYVRFRSPDAIVNEIRAILDRYPDTREIYLQSETLVVSIDFLRELSRALRELNQSLPEKISYISNFRVARQFLREETFELLQQAGVKLLEIGLESGSEKIRREVLRRHYTNEEFYQAVTLARSHGIDVNVYNMVGLPGETPEDHEETIEVNRRICPNRLNTSIFFPYPGTDLYETCRQMGLLQQQGNATSERSKATLDLPTFSKQQIQRAFEWFDFEVYRGHRPLQFRLRKVLRNKIYGNAWALSVFMRLLPLWHSLRGTKNKKN